MVVDCIVAQMCQPIKSLSTQLRFSNLVSTAKHVGCRLQLLCRFQGPTAWTLLMLLCGSTVPSEPAISARLVYMPTCPFRTEPFGVYDFPFFAGCICVPEENRIHQAVRLKPSVGTPGPGWAGRCLVYTAICRRWCSVW